MLVKLDYVQACNDGIRLSGPQCLPDVITLNGPQCLHDVLRLSGPQCLYGVIRLRGRKACMTSWGCGPQCQCDVIRFSGSQCLHDLIMLSGSQCLYVIKLSGVISAYTTNGHSIGTFLTSSFIIFDLPLPPYFPSTHSTPFTLQISNILLNTI